MSPLLKTHWSLGFGVWASCLAAGGCGKDGHELPGQPAAETGPCVEGECIAGLVCRSELCVDPNWNPSAGSGGTADTAASSTSSDDPGLQIDCEDIPDGAALAQYDYTPTAVGSQGIVGWSQSGLPPGFSFDPDTGQITGVPESEGSVSLELTVTDEQGASATEPCSFEVKAALDVDLALLLESPPYCVVPGKTLIDFLSEGTGDASDITCDVPGGTGNGQIPEGISVNADTCELEGELLDERYGVFAFMVRGSQSGREVWIPYCVQHDEQASEAYRIEVDHGDVPAELESPLIPIVGTFEPTQQFEVGGMGDPRFEITDPDVCGSACQYGFVFSMGASPFDTSGAFFLVVDDQLVVDGTGNPIGLEHGIFIDGPSADAEADFSELFGERPWVVNFALDYCLSETDGACLGSANIKTNGNGSLDQSILMFPTR